MDGLVSAKLKFIRASEHLNAIKNCLTAYRSRKPYEIVRHPDGKERLNITEEPPSDVGILSGEVLYQIRSALDHLIFELVKRNQVGIVLPARWEESCEFPIRCRLPPSITAPPVPKDLFTRICKLPGLADKPYTFIEGLQPYHDPARLGALELLAKLSNIDKHRHLHVAVSRGQRLERAVAANGSGPAMIQSGLDHGAEVEPLFTSADLPPDTVEVKREFFVHVTFDEPPLGEHNQVPIEHLLGHVLSFCQGFICSTFEAFLG